MLRLMTMRAGAGLVVACMLAACSQAGTPAEPPTAPMRADLSGVVSVQPAEAYVIDDRTNPPSFGPASLRFGDRVLEVPAGTPAFGVCPAMYPDNGLVAPCLLQLGLAANKVQWVRAMTVETQMLPPPGSEIVPTGVFTYGGTVAGVTDEEVRFTNGAVLPLRADATIECGNETREALVGRVVRLDLSPDPLEATGGGCLGSD